MASGNWQQTSSAVDELLIASDHTHIGNICWRFLYRFLTRLWTPNQPTREERDSIRARTPSSRQPEGWRASSFASSLLLPQVCSWFTQSVESLNQTLMHIKSYGTGRQCEAVSGRFINSEARNCFFELNWGVDATARGKEGNEKT